MALDFFSHLMGKTAARSGWLFRRLGIAVSDDYADRASAPTLTAGSGAPSSTDEPAGSVYLRTSGAIYRYIGGAWEQVFGAAGGLVGDTVSELTSAAGVTVDGVLLKDSTVDLNGVADALILDADGNTSISAPTNDQIDIEINGADDFTFTANTFTALSGSTIKADTIAETTSAAGVTVDGCLIKDGRAAALATAAMFLSAEITGNGASQDTAHGFGAAPSLVFVIPSDLTGGAFTVAYGVHDATNTKTTVTTGEKYRVVAFK